MAVSSEDELIRSCLEGDPQAWDLLFTTYYPPVGRFIYQLGGSRLTREDAEDIAQEVLMNAVRALKEFRGGARLQTWLFRIATNKTRDFLAKQTAAKRGGGQATLSLHQTSTEDEHPIVGEPAAASLAPDQYLEKMDENQLLQASLESLGDPCREIVELRYFGDLSYEELSATLKLNVKTVSSRLSKCLDQLEKIHAELVARSSGRKIPSNSQTD
jgi:RNA polymerase sigma-70 factor (ECF subfamily)